MGPPPGTWISFTLAWMQAFIRFTQVPTQFFSFMLTWEDQRGEILFFTHSLDQRGDARTPVQNSYRFVPGLHTNKALGTCRALPQGMRTG